MSTLVANRHTPVDASGGAVSMALPTDAAQGDEISVEKYDSSTNTVTVTGSIRGVGAQTVTLTLAKEAIGFRADSSGSWWPIYGHKTLSALGTALVPNGQGTARLTNWERKQKNDVANAKMLGWGDSTLNAATGPSPFFYARLGVSYASTAVPALNHMAPGEGLAGMTADSAHLIDAGNSGASLSVMLSNYDAGDTSAKSLRWVIAQAPDLIIFSWGINDVRLGATTKAQLIARINRAIGILRAALPSTDILLRIPNTLASNDYVNNHYVQDSSGNINPAGLAQTYSDLLRQAYYAVAVNWPNVVLYDAQTRVFGTRSLAVAGTSGSLMGDQLHPGQAGQYALADDLAQNFIGYYPAKVQQPASSTNAIAGSQYAPWTQDPSVLDDTSRFVLVASGAFSAQTAGSFLDFALNPVGNITNYDILRLPDGQVYQLPASGVTFTQNGPTTRLLSSGIPTSAVSQGQVRVYRQVISGDSNVNNVLADTSQRFRRLGRVVSGSTTAITIKAFSNSTARVMQPASEWAGFMAAGDKFYVEGDGANPITLSVGQFAASSTNLAITGLTAGTDYSTLVGRLVFVVGSHADATSGPAGPTGPAGGIAAPLVSGNYSNPALIGSASASAGTLGNAYMVPFVFSLDGQLDRALVDVGTAVAGATVRLALYSCDASNRPTTLLGEFTTAGALDCSTTGVKESATLATPIAVTKGTLYFLMVMIQGTAAANLRTISNLVNPQIVTSASSFTFASVYRSSPGASASPPATNSTYTVDSYTPFARVRAV